MSCAEYQAKIPGHLRQEASPAEQAAWERHLAVCPACREEWEALAKVWALLGAPASEEPSAALRDRVLTSARVELQGRPRPARRFAALRRHPGLATAALVVLCLGFGTGLATGWGLPTRPSPAGNLEVDRLLRVSPQERMISVALLSQGGHREPDSANALLTLVERDPCLDIRLAALDALYLYGDHPGLVERLETSLPLQASPRVQVAQVDLLLALREKRAMEALRKLLREPRLDPAVRERIQNNLAQRL